MKALTLVAILLCGCGDGGGSPAASQTHRQKLDVGPIVFIGDSITQLWPLYDYLVGAVNAGASGEDSWQMDARFQHDVLDRKPRTVVILAGTNDIRDRDSADPEHLFDMVYAARAAGMRVIVGTVPPMDINMGEYPDVEKQLVIVLNDKIRRGAGEHGYTVVDYHPAFLLTDGAMNTTLYADAYLHPNHAGYDAMWAKLQPLLH